MNEKPKWAVELAEALVSALTTILDKTPEIEAVPELAAIIHEHYAKADREALEIIDPFIRHDLKCKAWKSTAKCSCGLDEALALARGEK